MATGRVMGLKRNERGPGLLIGMSDVSITLLGRPRWLPDVPHSTCRMHSWSGAPCSSSLVRAAGAASFTRPSTRRWLGCTWADTSFSRRSPPGSGSVSPQPTPTPAVVDQIAEHAPGLVKTLREQEPDFFLLDGPLADCDRVGYGRADYPHEHRCRRVQRRPAAVALTRPAAVAMNCPP